MLFAYKRVIFAAAYMIPQFIHLKVLILVGPGLGWAVDRGGPWTRVGPGLGWALDPGGPWSRVCPGQGWALDMGRPLNSGGPWTFSGPQILCSEDF